MRVTVKVPGQTPYDGEMMIWVGGAGEPPRWVKSHPHGGRFLPDYTYSVLPDGADDVRAVLGCYLSGVTSANAKA